VPDSAYQCWGEKSLTGHDPDPVYHRQMYVAHTKEQALTVTDWDEHTFQNLNLVVTTLANKSQAHDSKEKDRKITVWVTDSRIFKFTRFKGPDWKEGQLEEMDPKSPSLPLWSLRCERYYRYVGICSWVPCF
jgi:hypothetical protein